MCAPASSVVMAFRCGRRVSLGQPRMTAARTRRPEAEGDFFSIGQSSFRNTSGLTNVPISSADLVHCGGSQGLRVATPACLLSNQKQPWALSGQCPNQAQAALRMSLSKDGATGCRQHGWMVGGSVLGGSLTRPPHRAQALEPLAVRRDSSPHSWVAQGVGMREHPHPQAVCLQMASEDSAERDGAGEGVRGWGRGASGLSVGLGPRLPP